MDTYSMILELQKKLPYGQMGRDSLDEIKSRLDSLNDTQRTDAFLKIQQAKLRSLISMAVWNLIFGTLGVARFMIGDIGLGFARLALQIIAIVFAILGGGDEESTFTAIAGLCVIAVWIWWFIDIFLVDKKVRMQNLRKVLLAIESVKNSK